MSDPHVLHLITRFLHGGAEQTTCNTLAALREADRNYDLRLGVGAAHDPDRLAAVEAAGVETVIFDSIRHYNPVTAVVAVGAVVRYLCTEDVDVVHTHSTEAGIIGRFAARLAGTPVVVHEIHGDPIAADRNPVLNAVLLRLERAAARCTTTLVVKSEHIRETYLARGIGRPEQYTVIYHGVEVAEFASATPTDIGDVPVVLFAGRLSEGKGLHDLLDAIARLRDGTTFEVRIAGDGPLAEDLAARVDREGLDDVVTLLGYRDDMPAQMAAADVFVLPSYREGTPRVITEALAAGTPVVSTRIAGIPEQVREGETGYLVDPGDVEALADRLGRLLADSDERATMGERAAASVEQFRADRATAAYRDLYASLVETRL